MRGGQWEETRDGSCIQNTDDVLGRVAAVAGDVSLARTHGVLCTSSHRREEHREKEQKGARDTYDVT